MDCQITHLSLVTVQETQVKPPVLPDPAPAVTALGWPQAAFTVDVEDYFHTTVFESRIARRDWHAFDCRVEANTHRLLDMLARHNVRGTFFVLGWVAEHYPQLVRAIHQAGHEIGSHSYWHRRVYHLTPEAFRTDLRRSRDVLAEITGQAVRCYRAPTFSINRQTLWALEVLVEEGFRVDSSIFPIYHHRYGIPRACTSIHRIDTPSGTICEFPPAVVQFGPLRLPASGGGYFRLYPFFWTRYCLARFARQNRHGFVFYVHPWEVDPRQPRLRLASRVSCFRHYLHLQTTEAKLERLLKTFRFAGIRDVLEGNPEFAAASLAYQ